MTTKIVIEYDELEEDIDYILNFIRKAIKDGYCDGKNPNWNMYKE